MKIAVISDIHGNIDALNAVLNDINNVDLIIFTGDFCGDLPFLGDVIDCVKELENALYIKGNREDYILSLSEIDVVEKKYDQFGPLYWQREQLSNEQLDFLSQLEPTLDIELNGFKISVRHSIEEHFDNKYSDYQSSKYFSSFYDDIRDFEHDIENAYKDENLTFCKEPADIYLFGHSHLQWSIKHGDIYFINAGSCGMPLDKKTTAPYTIIELTDSITITQKRAFYNVGKTIEKINETSIVESGIVWMNLVLRQLSEGEECVAYYFDHVLKETQGVFPIPNDIWNQSFKEWDTLELSYRNRYIKKMKH